MVTCIITHAEDTARAVIGQGDRKIASQGFQRQHCPPLGVRRNLGKKGQLLGRWGEAADTRVRSEEPVRAVPGPQVQSGMGCNGNGDAQQQAG